MHKARIAATVRNAQELSGHPDLPVALGQGLVVTGNTLLRRASRTPRRSADAGNQPTSPPGTPGDVSAECARGLALSHPLPLELTHRAGSYARAVAVTTTTVLSGASVRQSDAVALVWQHRRNGRGRVWMPLPPTLSRDRSANRAHRGTLTTAASRLNETPQGFVAKTTFKRSRDTCVLAAGLAGCSGQFPQLLVTAA